jgi:membrane-bound lytic murein transglycosylase A
MDRPGGPRAEPPPFTANVAQKPLGGGGWGELPGVPQDSLNEAWNAWIKNCERPSTVFANLCGEVRRLSMPRRRAAQLDDEHAAALSHRRPRRPRRHADRLLRAAVTPAASQGRLQRAALQVPQGTAKRKPWFTRQQIDTLPEAQAALAGRAIAWLRDPVDMLVLHIQGSGRLMLTEADGRQRMIRVAYAGTNDQPYKSVGRWLLDQNLVRDATWPGISAWIAPTPRVNEMLWSNPRYVFFREEALNDFDAQFGPKGAQGVALTPGRSIAVDRNSIPYGTPVWLSTRPYGLAQPPGVGAGYGQRHSGRRARRLFHGLGAEAGDVAGASSSRCKLWACGPRPCRCADRLCRICRRWALLAQLSGRECSRVQFRAMCAE